MRIEKPTKYEDIQPDLMEYIYMYNPYYSYTYMIFEFAPKWDISKLIAMSIGIIQKDAIVFSASILVLTGVISTDFWALNLHNYKPVSSNIVATVAILAQVWCGTAS